VDLKPKSVLEEVIPPFFESRFVVQGISEKKKGKSVIVSPVVRHEGVEWRLKVFPSGVENF
jgi:hypothetical protein